MMKDNRVYYSRKIIIAITATADLLYNHCIDNIFSGCKHKGCQNLLDYIKGKNNGNRKGRACFNYI
jgi:hypothetical protein